MKPWSQLLIVIKVISCTVVNFVALSYLCFCEESSPGAGSLLDSYGSEISSFWRIWNRELSSYIWSISFVLNMLFLRTSGFPFSGTWCQNGKWITNVLHLLIRVCLCSMTTRMSVVCVILEELQDGDSFSFAHFASSVEEIWENLLYTLP